MLYTADASYLSKETLYDLNNKSESIIKASCDWFNTYPENKCFKNTSLFSGICYLQQTKPENLHSGLIMVSKTGYHSLFAGAARYSFLPWGRNVSAQKKVLRALCTLIGGSTERMRSPDSQVMVVILTTPWKSFWSMSSKAL